MEDPDEPRCTARANGLLLRPVMSVSKSLYMLEHPKAKRTQTSDNRLDVTMGNQQATTLRTGGVRSLRGQTRDSRMWDDDMVRTLMRVSENSGTETTIPYESKVTIRAFILREFYLPSAPIAQPRYGRKLGNSTFQNKL